MQIPNPKSQIPMGFTLIEVVVAVGLFAVLAIAGNLLLVSVLRGSKKAQAVALVRSEGGYALGVIIDLVRYSRRVTACDGASVTVEDLAGASSTFACVAAGNDVYLASNSARLTSNKVIVDSCPGVFVCDAPPPRTGAVKINFSLHRAGAPLLIEAAAIDFSSQVALRN